MFTGAGNLALQNGNHLMSRHHLNRAVEPVVKVKIVLGPPTELLR